MEKVNEKRAELCRLSVQAREIRNAKSDQAETVEESIYWESRTLNSIIIDNFYKDDKHKIFKTFKER
jgi:hypothetical protein